MESTSWQGRRLFGITHYNHHDGRGAEYFAKIDVMDLQFWYVLIM